MNGQNLAIGSGATPLIAQCLMYLTHWPLAPMDNTTAGAFAGLVVMFVGGGGLAWLESRKAGNAAAPSTTPGAP